MEELKPREIVEILDKYVIGQKEAKKAVSIALRNRFRRRMLKSPLKDEIMPKNIIMIGPTGVGKTEIARRVAKFINAPFLKVEVTKYTEVGYVGRDVESMVRDLVELAISKEKSIKTNEVREKAKKMAEERVLDILLPKKSSFSSAAEKARELIGGMMDDSDYRAEEPEKKEDFDSREKFRKLLIEGKLNDR
ncbi:MAG: AAA family ATPase, partial [Candidatus Muiribacteriota bacterium]